MMKTYICLILLLWGVDNFAQLVQNRWEKIGYIEFTALARQSPTTIVATTNHGYLYVSTDAGLSWERRFFNDTLQLVGVSFIDSLHGAVAERSGLIFFTSDGGATWEWSKIPLSPVLVGPDEYRSAWVSQIAYPSPDTLYATDMATGAIWRTADRGISWSKISLPDSISATVIYFLDAKHGFAGRDACYETQDAGETWSKQELEFLEGEKTSIYSIDFYGDTGIIGGFKYFWVSTNGGKAWTVHELPDTIISRWGMSINTGLGQVKLINGSEFFGFLQGLGIPYMYSNDLGSSFSISTIEVSSAHTNGITFLPDKGAIAIGNIGLVLTSPNGREWNISNLCKWQTEMSTAIFDNIMYAFPQGNSSVASFLSSSDRGISWHSKEINGITGSGMHFISKDTGYIFSNVLSRTIATTDGGKTWDSVGAAGNRGFRTVSFSGHTGYAVSYEEIMVTTDDGRSWSNIPVAPDTVSPYPDAMTYSTILKGSFALDSLKGFVFTKTMDKVAKQVFKYHSRLLRTTDGGKTWAVDTNAPIDLMQCVYFRDRLNGFIGSIDGKMFRTTNGGITWTPMQLPIGTINSINFMNDSVGFAGGIGKALAMTTDGGASWQIELLPVTSVEFLDTRIYDDPPNVWSFSFPDSSTVLLGTTTGIFYKKLTRQPSVVESSPHLSTFLLITTHPNPAAGILHIKLHGIFSNPNAPLTAGMYDLLGRKIMDLSNLARGGNNGVVSEFEVDVSAIPPGVYTLQYTLGSLSRAQPVIVMR